MDQEYKKRNYHSTTDELSKINNLFNNVLEESKIKLDLLNYTEIYYKENFKLKTQDFNQLLFSCNRNCFQNLNVSIDTSSENKKFNIDKFNNICLRKCYKYGYTLNNLILYKEGEIENVGENV